MAKNPSPYAKPGPYVTKLDPIQEARFQFWVQNNKVPFEDSPTSDYDMRGYWKAMLGGDPNAKQQLNQSDGLMHFPDTYKTPYHDTFSNESMYATPDAPRWTGNDNTGWKLIDKNGGTVFDESPVKSTPVPDMPDYTSPGIGNLIKQTLGVKQ